MDINVTEIRVTIRDDDKLRAFVSITLEDCFVIRGLKIIQGGSGMFVAMPSRKKPNGEYQDLCHPINRHTRQSLERAILAKYHEEVERSAVVQ